MSQDALYNALFRVRALLQQGWCQRVWAQDAEGKIVRPHSSSACRWCLSGAIECVAFGEELRDVPVATSIFCLSHAVRDGLLPGYTTPDLFAYNDRPTTTQQDVIMVLDRAIAEARP